MTEWACPCGPHTEQIYDFWDTVDSVGIPLLCFKHGKHEPCRPCLREEEQCLSTKNPTRSEQPRG